jgi:hypothetical protein
MLLDIVYGNDSVYQYEYSNWNLWEFYIDDGNPDSVGNIDLRRLTQSVSIPSMGFDFQQNENTLFIEPGRLINDVEFSITVLDEVDHKVYNWYYEWLESFFNFRTRTWYNDVNPTRQGYLTFQKFENNSGYSNSMIVGQTTNNPEGIDAKKRKLDLVQTEQYHFMNIYPKKPESREANYIKTDAPMLTFNFICEWVNHTIGEVS